MLLSALRGRAYVDVLTVIVSKSQISIVGVIKSLKKLILRLWNKYSSEPNNSYIHLQYACDKFYSHLIESSKPYSNIFTSKQCAASTF